MKNISSKINDRGFTLVELGVVIGILAVLLSFATIGLSSVQQKVSINTTVQTIISDMKEQQIKAMIGDTEGRPSGSAYGVHFDTNQYVLFNGAYSVAEPSNFVVTLPSNLEFTTSGVNVIFSQTEGELGSPASVTISSTASNEQKTIQLNKYGVVTGVN